MLENHADVLTHFLDVFVGDEDVLKEYIAGGGLFHVIDTAQEGGFAGAASAQYYYIFTAMQSKIYTSQYFVGAVRFFEIVDGDDVVLHLGLLSVAFS